MSSGLIFSSVIRTLVVVVELTVVVLVLVVVLGRGVTVVVVVVLVVVVGGTLPNRGQKSRLHSSKIIFYFFKSFLYRIFKSNDFFLKTLIKFGRIKSDTILKSTFKFE